MVKNLFALCAVLFLIGGCSSMKNDNADEGVSTGELAPCPESPNCVSSLENEASHAIPPIEYRGIDRNQAMETMLSVLENEKRCRIITVVKDEPGYIHAEFRSFLFRFTDDTEFLFPADESVIHVRSASRVGYSDMGVNRKRLERLRERFTALSP